MLLKTVTSHYVFILTVSEFATETLLTVSSENPWFSIVSDHLPSSKVKVDLCIEELGGSMLRLTNQNPEFDMEFTFDGFTVRVLHPLQSFEAAQGEWLELIDGSRFKVNVANRLRRVNGSNDLRRLLMESPPPAKLRRTKSPELQETREMRLIRGLAALIPRHFLPYELTRINRKFHISANVDLRRLLEAAAARSDCDFICDVYAWLLLERFLKTGQVTFSRETAHGLVSTSIFLAHKFVSDRKISDRSYSRFLNVPVDILNELASIMLKALDWRLWLPHELVASRAQYLEAQIHKLQAFG